MCCLYHSILFHLNTKHTKHTKIVKKKLDDDDEKKKNIQKESLYSQYTNANAHVQHYYYTDAFQIVHCVCVYVCNVCIVVE